MAEDAAACGFWEIDFAEFGALDSRDAVVFGKFTVEEAVVGGEEFVEWEVLLKEVGEEMLGFLAHGAFEIVAVVVSEISGGRHFTDVVEFEPDAEEVAGEAFAFLIVKHSIDLLFENFVVVEGVVFCELEKTFVGQSGPEKVGETGGEGVRVEVALVFFQVEKSGRAKDGLEAELEGFQGGNSGVEFGGNERKDGLEFAFVRSSAEGVLGEEAKPLVNDFLI